MIAIMSCNKRSIQEIEKFDPDFYIGDYVNSSIVNGDKVIACNDIKFNMYACMHVDKVKELNRILSRYRRKAPLTVGKVEGLIHDLEN